MIKDIKNKIMNSKFKFVFKLYLLIPALLVIVNTVSAQTEAVPPAAGEMNMNTYYTILFIVFLLLLNAVFLPLLRSPETEQELTAALAGVKSKSVFGILKDKISGLQPIETEHTLLIDEDYDGIQELDNNVPPWFNILFYGTVIIGIIYFLNFHVFKTGKLPFQEYSDEIFAAQLQREELIRTGAFINENTVEQLKDPESLASGKQIFVANCTPCHGENGGGTVGPNLTDQYWIHGGGIKNVFTTIKYGVTVKGMIAWQNQFNPKKMQQVASYVLSLQGTNPANGKPPEGNLFTDKGDSTKSVSDSTKKNTSVTDSTRKDTTKIRK